MNKLHDGKYAYLIGTDKNSNMDPAMQQRKDKYVKPSADMPQVVYIQVSWVLMWCLTLEDQEDKENWFRLKQLLQVLQQLNSENNVFKTELYFLLIDTTF